MVARLSRVEAEVASGRELIRSLQRDGESGATSRRRLEEEVGEAKQQAAFAREDGRRAKLRANELADQLEGANGLLDDLREQVAAAEDAKQAVQSTLEELKSSATADRERLHALQGQAHTLQSELEGSRAAEKEREAEVAQLKALVSRMDVGHKELTDKLKANLQTLAEVQAAREAMTSQLDGNAKKLQEHESTILQLRQVLGALDHERDALLTEVDEKAEELDRLRSSTQ